MRWTDAKKKLPTDTTTVVIWVIQKVTMKGYVDVGFFSPVSNEWRSSDGEIVEVSHWAKATAPREPAPKVT